ncbi:MAG TPA: pantoate--beta-alanine ligase [Candidatus Saccharimonadales bacterium]|nr:pantoate--beta-alanine ligase [Candidatus Saccharimonadales bacterium]
MATQSQSVGMAHVVRTRADVREALALLPRPIGLVPTMGWLHAGHRSLMQRSLTENATTVVTIFVNPRQFNSPDDLARYPRNEPRDLAITADEGVDLVFSPPVDEVYLPGFETTVSVGPLAEVLEGAARPGHFDGVATVVAILFNLVGADRAYFGQKDAQQVRVIERMARDLAIATVVIPCPTVREPDGLALSSRNALLTREQRAAAPVVHRALLAARAAYDAGERSADRLRDAMREVLTAEPAAAPEYVSAAATDDLRELDVVEGPALLSVAVRFGSTRLIDNELIGE